MKALRIIGGFLLGLVVGAAAVLLFVPQSGRDTQGQLRQRIEDILLEGRQAGEARRMELTTRFEALKQSHPRT